MTILLFFAVLFVLILVHEWGHFIVAKFTGMRVDEFGIGFPPRLFGKKWHGTLYTLNALPIGGFVRIWGENGDEPFSPVESEASDRRSEASGEGGAKSAQLEASAEAGEGGANSGSFMSKSKWAQAAVLIAGVTMNIIFAWFLFVLVFMMGVPTPVSPEEATDAAQFTVTHVSQDSPAALVGIPVGVQIVAVTSGETKLDRLEPEAFSSFIRGAQEPVVLTYKKDDAELTVAVTPEAGLIAEDPEKKAIGVGIALIENVRRPIHIAVYEAMKTTGGALVTITAGITTLIAQSVQGTADFSQVAGPVGIVGMVGDAAEFGLTSLLMFTAMISLNLAVINMLPLPALDGGRLLFVVIEAVTRRPINPVWVARLNLFGFAFLMILMIAVTYNDIAKIL